MNNIDPQLITANTEEVSIRGYDTQWPQKFADESKYLLQSLPDDLVRRVEHFGSTAIPGLAAKPIIDMLIEVSDLNRVKEEVAPLMIEQGYDYFWRPTFTSEDGEPFYAWFIKRDASGTRTHHLHMIEADFPHWERLLFRDYLIEHPDSALAYSRLKNELAILHPNDRTAYTAGKSDFIADIMNQIGEQGSAHQPATRSESKF